MRLRPALFWPLVLIQLWFAHAIGYLAHEYAHSFTAWIAHSKANPLALNYGHLSLKNILLQAISMRMSTTIQSSRAVAVGWRL